MEQAMAKAENETTPRDQFTRDQFDKIRANVLEALRTLPIRRDRIVDTENAADELAGPLSWVPIREGLRKEARKVAPAAVSKQLNEIVCATMDLVNLLMFSTEAMSLIESELDRLPRDRWGAGVSPVYGSLINLVRAAEAVSKIASPIPKRGRPANLTAARLTDQAAEVYRRLTGKTASRSSAAFQAFLARLFEIGGISANPDRRSRTLAEKRPKISI
jgi:hypothetical protein